MKITNPIGKKGEDLAADYLRKLDYKILDRNYRKKYEELDIVAIDKKEKSLVFIEVKTRTSSRFGETKESIGYWKLKRLISAAQLYKVSHKNLPELLRIDAIFVSMEDGVLRELEHIKNISL